MKSGVIGMTLSVKHKVSTPNVEMLTVSVRSFNTPREFSHILVTDVYVPPSANAKAAANVISSHMHDLKLQPPYTLKIITGDFNRSSLKTSITSYF